MMGIAHAAVPTPAFLCLLCLCSKDSTTVIACYLELADKVRSGLGHIDPYFAKIADAMVAWIQSWQAMNPEFEK